MTNQKPFSINETKNKSGSKKSGLLFNEDGYCYACVYNEHKNKIDWDLREKNLEKCYLNSEKMMDLMIVLYQGAEVKIVNFKHIF